MCLCIWADTCWLQNHSVLDDDGDGDDGDGDDTEAAAAAVMSGVAGV